MTHAMVEAHTLVSKALADAQYAFAAEDIEDADPKEVYSLILSMRDTVSAYEQLCATVATYN